MTAQEYALSLLDVETAGGCASFGFTSRDAAGVAAVLVALGADPDDFSGGDEMGEGLSGPATGLRPEELLSRAGFCESWIRRGSTCVCGLHLREDDGSWLRTPALAELFASDLEPQWPADPGARGGLPEASSPS